MSLQKTGTVHFKLTHKNSNWATNKNQYKLGPFHLSENLDVVAFKKADRTLDIRIVFEHFAHTFSGKLPSSTPSGGLPILITWSEKVIRLWVNGVKTNSAPFNPLSSD